MIFQLDGRLMTDKKEMHEYIAQQLMLPVHYGRNLDALYDALTDMKSGSEIVIINASAMEEIPGAYYKAVIKTFEDAARANPGLEVRIQK